MLCCLIIAFFGGPFLFWTGPDMARQSDCCAGSRRSILARSAVVFGVGALCLAMILLAWFQPAPFRHICSVLAPS